MSSILCLQSCIQTLLTDIGTILCALN